MSKSTRVLFLMVGMVIFAMAMLDLVRSQVEARGRAFRSAANQYSAVRRIYTAPLDLLHSTVRAREQGK